MESKTLSFGEKSCNKIDHSRAYTQDIKTEDERKLKRITVSELLTHYNKIETVPRISKR